eukprot:gnl/TRDRNA2_/TRDRNA2_194993_c0_seq1.p1 gnl/TRDRNA2_/TRDRNA2_194993_c0~~gnl/TRDRNA2_/TRDRNA2_194993_c0_seq1.p1  ORF type:complete len:244 (-),score=41.24 gnl/TRDRNA2_/TRDRNA2_194993_c0_seq1:90-821(-)
MAHWKAPSKMTSTFLIVLLLSNEILDCHAKVEITRQFRGTSDLKQTNELSFWDRIIGGSAVRPKLELMTEEVDAVPRTASQAHAALSRRLQAKAFVPRQASSPFIVPQSRRPVYNAPHLAKGFSEHVYSRHVARDMQALSALKGADIRSMLARQGEVTATGRKKFPVQMSLFGLGPGELLVIGAVALFIFGPEGLKGAGKRLGATARELKGAASEFSEELKAESDKPALPDAVASNATKTASE